MLESLLYVSRSKLDAAELDIELALIDRAARIRNKAAGITGALVATPGCFAQLLEGEPADLDRLMASIAVDPRHHDIVIISRSPIAERQCAKWLTMCVNQSSYVSNIIAPLVDVPAVVTDLAIRNLTTLVVGLVS